MNMGSPDNLGNSEETSRDFATLVIMVTSKPMIGTINIATCRH
jgi:hypothetical protein